jgi:hypothetical protein
MKEGMRIRQCDGTYPNGNFSSVDEPCNMDMRCRGQKGSGGGGGGGGREYCVKNTVSLAKVISVLVVWQVQTQQETDISEIKLFTLISSIK